MAQALEIGMGKCPAEVVWGGCPRVECCGELSGGSGDVWIFYKSLRIAVMISATLV